MHAFKVGNEDKYVVVSGYDKDGMGGLFVIDSSGYEQLDDLATTGICISSNDHLFIRILRSVPEYSCVGEMLIYDINGLRKYTRLDSILDPHDVLQYGQSYLIACAYSNTVYKVDTNGDTSEYWRSHVKGDSWHINSLAYVDGNIYASIFGRHKQHRKWTKYFGKHRGMIMNISKGFDVINKLDAPHSINFRDGHWIVCNSYNNEVLEFDGNNRIRKRAKLDRWTRGLAFTDDYLFVGESCTRGEEKQEYATVAMLDSDTWECKNKIEIPAYEIYDIRVAPKEIIDGIKRGARSNLLRVTGFRREDKEYYEIWQSGEVADEIDCRIHVMCDIAGAVTAKSDISVCCQIVNEGMNILASVPDNPLRLSYRWFESESGKYIEGIDENRTGLPRYILPGKEIELEMLVRTPEIPGKYEIRISLVQEAIRWFDDVDISNASIHHIIVVDEEGESI